MDTIDLRNINQTWNTPEAIEYRKKAKERNQRFWAKERQSADYQRWLKEYNEARERRGLPAFVPSQS